MNGKSKSVELLRSKRNMAESFLYCSDNHTSSW